MNETQPPRRRIDFSGLRVPPSRYYLPAPGETLHLGPTAADRLNDHFAGRLPLSSLTAAETEFLRDYFLEQLAENREQNMAHFERKVPRRYADAAADDSATAWASSVTTDPRHTSSLLVLGPTGVGKTHYAWSVLRAVAETGARMGWAAYTAPDLFAHLRPSPGRDDEQALQDLIRLDLLFIDDLGAAKLSDWTEEITYRVVNYRYEHCLPGIYTSNIPPKELAAAVGARVASRLTEMCKRISLKGEDLRKGARP